MDDACTTCKKDPCLCGGGDFSTDAPGAEEAATPEGGDAEGDKAEGDKAEGGGFGL